MGDPRAALPDRVFSAHTGNIYAVFLPERLLGLACAGDIVLPQEDGVWTLSRPLGRRSLHPGRKYWRAIEGFTSAIMEGPRVDHG